MSTATAPSPSPEEEPAEELASIRRMARLDQDLAEQREVHVAVAREQSLCAAIYYNTLLENKVPQKWAARWAGQFQHQMSEERMAKIMAESQGNEP